MQARYTENPEQEIGLEKDKKKYDIEKSSPIWQNSEYLQKKCSVK